MKKKQIKQFINHFHNISMTDNLTEIFTSGCCYWFAHILCSRFEGSEIMYDPVVNHFVSKIENRLYDVTGDVTGKYDVVKWENFDDEIEKQRIIDCCIDFRSQ